VRDCSSVSVLARVMLVCVIIPVLVCATILLYLYLLVCVTVPVLVRVCSCSFVPALARVCNCTSILVPVDLYMYSLVCVTVYSCFVRKCTHMFTELYSYFMTSLYLDFYSCVHVLGILRFSLSMPTEVLFYEHGK
jgi:hypothetical protein